MFSVGQGLLLSFLRRKGRGGRWRAPWSAACTIRLDPPRPILPGTASGRPGASGAAPRPSGSPALYKTASSKTRQLGVVYNIQPKLRASYRAGRRPAGCSGWAVRAAGPTAKEIWPRLFSVELFSVELFSVEKTGQLQIFLSNKMPRIISGNIHRIVHPFHSGMFTYMSATRSAKEIKNT